MLPSIDPEDVGNTGLIWLFATYGYVLFRASNLISEGSELLLLVPSLAGLVGGVILPLLGAVPDGAIMLFSGMGDIEQAQESLSVGIGALAGSTIMLLTIPWGLSVIAGSVAITETDGKKKAIYTSPKQTEGSLSETGVAITDTIKKGSFIMVLTTIPYFVIQVPAFFIKENLAVGERYWALIGFIICISGFVGYLYVNVKASQEDEAKYHRTQVMAKLLRSGQMSLAGVFDDVIDTFDTTGASRTNDENSALVQPNDDEPSAKLKDYLCTVLLPSFNKYDVDGNGTLQCSEIKKFLTDFHETVTDDEVKTLFIKYDKDKSGAVDFDEFCSGCYSFLMAARRDESANVESVLAKTAVHAVLSDGGEEEEDIPEGIAQLPADQQQYAIKKMAFSMLALGTFLVLMFADPMVDVMQEIAVRVNISPFYVSFVLAPLASNASEVIASQYYASKKTTKTITVSLSALQGAACMNNTFCLAIFMGLIYFRGLAWQYTAETISILVVQYIIYAMTRADTMSGLEGVIIMSIFPLSIMLVAGLEYLGFD